MFKWMTGYRSYAIAAAAAAIAAANALGYPVPEWVLILLGAGGLGALRAAK
jgi:hypothetical protein